MVLPMTGRLIGCTAICCWGESTVEGTRESPVQVEMERYLSPNGQPVVYRVDIVLGGSLH